MISITLPSQWHMVVLRQPAAPLVCPSPSSVVEWRHWRTAADFIAGYQDAPRQPALICLDHDLFTEHPDDPDPGDGREVAEYLANQTPACHVIIHSSNAPAANSMYFTLEDAGWDVERIAPLGADWIETYWWSTAKPWLITT